MQRGQTNFSHSTIKDQKVHIGDSAVVSMRSAKLHGALQLVLCTSDAEAAIATVMHRGALN